MDAFRQLLEDVSRRLPLFVGHLFEPNFLPPLDLLTDADMDRLADLAIRFNPSTSQIDLWVPDPYVRPESLRDRFLASGHLHPDEAKLVRFQTARTDTAEDWLPAEEEIGEVVPVEFVYSSTWGGLRWNGVESPPPPPSPARGEGGRDEPSVEEGGGSEDRPGSGQGDSAEPQWLHDKMQRQAEEAELAWQRAEDVARRKATDIIFLGRGVSNRLSDRRCDAEKLAEQGLPVFATPAELAAALGLPVPKLRWLAYHNEVATRIHYIQFQIPKKNGGTRTLSAPHRSLAAAQRWVLETILNKLSTAESAHGFIPSRSILTNATAHAGQSFVVNLDLEGFFPSIGFERVRSVFQKMGYSPAVGTILALLCTECPRREVRYDDIRYWVATGPRGLPQGACTSPALSNQVARRLDNRLAGLAARLGLRYTRYADDLSFSGPDEMKPRLGYLMRQVRRIVLAEGFVLNEAKSRVQRRNTAQTVTGLVVNDRPGVSRDMVRRLRAILHRAKTEGLDAQNREGRPHFRAWVEGMIAYVGMVRPEVGARLRAELAALPAT